MINRGPLSARFAKRGIELVEGDRLGVRRCRLHAQDPEPRPWLDRDLAPPLDGAQVVGSVSEEHERVVAQPAQKDLDLGQLGTAGGRPRRVLLELRDHTVDGLLHGPEVVRDPHHVVQAALEIRPQRLDVARVGDARDLAMHEAVAGLAALRAPHLDYAALLVPAHVRHRIDDVLDRQVVRGDALAHRIDHERPVGDERVHGGRRIRRHDLDVHPVGRGALEEAEHVEHRARERLGAALQEQVGGRLGQQDVRERPEHLRFVGSGQPLYLAPDGRQGGGLPAVGRDRRLAAVAHGRDQPA